MSDSPAPSPSRPARIFQAAVGAVLVLAGLGFAWGLVVAWRKAEITRSWVETPCSITASGIELQGTGPGRSEWSASVRYRYEWDGRTYEGSRIRRIEGPTPDRDKATARAARYPAGASARCFVDPADPRSAVLEHSTRAALYSVWFPLLFAVGGAGMIVSALKSGRNPQNPAPASAPPRP